MTYSSKLQNLAGWVMSEFPSDDQDLFEGTIGFLDCWQAGLIRRCKSDSSLRLFGCAMTRFAMSQPVTVDPLCRQAVETAERFARGECLLDELNRMRSQLIPLADELEDKRLSLLEAEENRTVTVEESVQISTRAGIAKAALFCLYQSANTAAARAAYEVEYATNVMFYSEEEFEQKKREIAELLCR